MSTTRYARVRYLAGTQTYVQANPDPFTPNVPTWGTMTFDTVVEDNASFWSAGQPTRLTAAKPGVFVIGATYAASPPFAVDFYIAALLNGATIIGVQFGGMGALEGAYWQRQCLECTWKLNAGDYVEILYCTGSGTCTLQQEGLYSMSAWIYSLPGN